jgi:hypothetical protein
MILLLAAAVLGASCNMIRRPRGSRRALRKAADSFRPPALELPQLTAPQPLPAARVLDIFFTSTVVGDLEPCG